jgi:hypothetical protein
MAPERGQRPRAAAFVGDRVRVAEAEREVRIVVEEERGNVIVVDEEQHIGFFLGEPRAHGREAFEDRLPRRVVGFLRVDRERDRRRV